MDMKYRFLILFFIMALVTPGGAAELYSCIDRDGSRVVTDNPQDGMEDCVLKEVYDDLTAEQRGQNRRDIETKQSSGQTASGSKQEDALRKKCASLPYYRQEAATYCVGIPKSLKSNDDAMKKAAQSRLTQGGPSASRNCDYYSGLVKELEAKCR